MENNFSPSGNFFHISILDIELTSTPPHPLFNKEGEEDTPLSFIKRGLGRVGELPLTPSLTKRGSDQLPLPLAKGGGGGRVGGTLSHFLFSKEGDN